MHSINRRLDKAGINVEEREMILGTLGAKWGVWLSCEEGVAVALTEEDEAQLAAIRGCPQQVLLQRQ